MNALPMFEDLDSLSSADIVGSIKCWASWQEKHSQDVIQEDASIFVHEDKPLTNISYIGGLDISFPAPKENDHVHAVAALVIHSYPDLQVQHKVFKFVHLATPYIPEYLAFREALPLVSLVKDVQENKPDIAPQVLMVDGNGVLHPRGFGLACHVGVELDIPTIGVAKSLFHVDGIEKNEEFENTKRERLLKQGDSFPLVGNSGKIYGRALRSTNVAKNPVFVSIGSKISLDTACELVVSCCRHRIPEPVRVADIESREYVSKAYQDHVNGCEEDWVKLSSQYSALEERIRKARAYEHQLTS